MMNEYLCRSYVAEEILSEVLAAEPPRAEKRVGSPPPPPKSEEGHGRISTKLKKVVDLGALKDNLLTDPGSSNYKNWLARTTTLEDIYRHYEDSAAEDDEVSNHVAFPSDDDYDGEVTGYAIERPSPPSPVRRPHPVAGGKMAGGYYGASGGAASEYGRGVTTWRLTIGVGTMVATASYRIYCLDGRGAAVGRNLASPRKLRPTDAPRPAGKVRPSFPGYRSRGPRFDPLRSKPLGLDTGSTQPPSSYAAGGGGGIPTGYGAPIGGGGVSTGYAAPVAAGGGGGYGGGGGGVSTGYAAPMAGGGGYGGGGGGVSTGYGAPMAGGGGGYGGGGGGVSTGYGVPAGGGGGYEKKAQKKGGMPMEDMFDMALTAMAFMAFAMFKMHIVMCLMQTSDSGTFPWNWTHHHNPRVDKDSVLDFKGEPSFLFQMMPTTTTTAAPAPAPVMTVVMPPSVNFPSLPSGMLPGGMLPGGMLPGGMLPGGMLPGGNINIPGGDLNFPGLNGGDINFPGLPGAGGGGAIRFRRATPPSSNAVLDEMARRALESMEAFHLAGKDGGECLRRLLCENNRFSRSLEGRDKIWLPVWR
uniref:Uncharacterized protein n=1 Tax=Timema douglasi TaxID=61478 RepID=A0A7R8ZC39_TIMDO|nr:unnamed protein product [Timema douglasi]